MGKKTSSYRQVLLHSISQLVTMSGASGYRIGKQMNDLGVIEDASVLIEDDSIRWVGPSASLDKDLLKDPYDVDCTGRTVLPGFVDCHTHTMFTGSRENEFALRASGASYQEIAQRGGGILSTVRSVRASTKRELKQLTSQRLDAMLRHGTTTVEIKSGYGLEEKSERLMLEGLNELHKEHYVSISPTFLGAHAIPPEFDGDGQKYLTFLADRMLPYIMQRSLAGTCDIFCETGYFDIASTRTFLQRAKDLGFLLRLHADQLTDIGASALGAELGAVSVDHLECFPVSNIPLLKKSGTAAVLLPGSTFFLGGPYAPARDLIDGNVPVALATNFNPGSSMSFSMPMMMTIACTQMNMSVEECLTATTINAATVLGRSNETGSIAPGKKADLVVYDAPSYAYIPYHFGENHVRTVVKHGIVFDIS